MRIIRILLLPFAIIYGFVVRARNLLYDKGFYKQYSFDIPIIVVGNLSVGGTGKTPMVNYLVNHFIQQGKKVASLSRGYGRNTKGFKICSDLDTAKSIGDEPYTYYENFGNKALVCVGENRVKAIQQIKKKDAGINLILMDDAFQHRAVKAQVNIILTTFQRPFWKDFLLPTGYLREPRSSYQRADIIILTQSIQLINYPLNKRIPFFQTKIVYKAKVSLFDTPCTDRVIVISGLANNDVFFDHIKEHYKVVKTISYRDHYNYNQTDIKHFIKLMSDHKASLITTHKDAVKLKEFDQLKKCAVSYIPIEIVFLNTKDPQKFFQMLPN